VNYFAIGRDVLFAIALGFLVWWIYRAGEDRINAKDFKDLQTAVQRQGEILTGWRKESRDALDNLSKSVSSINAQPVVRHEWLRPPTDCPKPGVLPGASGQAGSADSSAGGLQSGRGSNAEGLRRDAILDAFKKRWETKLAEWRAEDAQWPH
jgi:hypothetical protein